MRAEFSGYLVSDEKGLLQVDALHAALREAYWCKGIPRETIVAAIERSLCFGVYYDF